MTVQTFSLSSYLSNFQLYQAKQTLSWLNELPLVSRLVVEVAWVADDGLLLKEIDRAGRVGNVVLFQNGVSEGTIVRTSGKDGEQGDTGWIELVSIPQIKSITMIDDAQGQYVVPVKSMLPGYLDIVPNEGYNHLAFFSPVNSSRPIWITSGEWEVTKIAAVDNDRTTA